ACRLPVPVLESNLDERSPLRVRREEESGSVLRDEPVFAKAYRACDGHRVAFVHAANAERVVGLVFRAVRDFVVKGQRRFSRYLIASGDWLLMGKPKTSARGYLGIAHNSPSTKVISDAPHLNKDNLSPHFACGTGAASHA